MKFLREPLFHFLLIGAALFGAYRLLNGSTTDGATTITVTATDIDALTETFTYTQHRAPSAAEQDSLIERHVREEVLIREARALGLDQEDGIIRDRLREKMLFVLGDTAQQAVDRLRKNYTVTINTKNAR